MLMLLAINTNQQVLEALFICAFPCTFTVLCKRLHPEMLQCLVFLSAYFFHCTLRDYNVNLSHHVPIWAESAFCPSNYQAATPLQ